jgi:hypothetical protein
MDNAVAITVLALASAVATGMLRVPSVLASVYVAIALVVSALVAYDRYPAIALSLLVLAAILYFRRNVQNVLEIAAASTYAETAIREQPALQTMPYDSPMSAPRTFNEFRETDAENPMHGQVREGFAATAAAAVVAAGEPAPFGGDLAAESVEGMYPIDADRPQAPLNAVDAFVYRPAEDMGSNEFVASGPTIDEKKKHLAY